MKTNGNRVIERLIEIYECGKREDGSYSRLAFSAEDLLGREKFIGYFIDLGMSVTMDTAGNLIARLDGKDQSLPSIVIGSHLDTVPNGGKYDGVLGCVAGLEVCQTFVEANHVPNHSIEVIVFTDEEGARFGSGLFGVDAFCGIPSKVQSSDLDVYGQSRDEVFKAYGICVSEMEKAVRRKDSIHCFLELHIEQGASLYKSGIPIGVVSSIAGVKRFEVTINGQANHSGSTLMSERKDALVAAAKFIADVPHIAKEFGNAFTVATVGFIQAVPNSVNVVPGCCKFSLEIRDQYTETMKRLESELTKKLAKICAEFADSYTIKQISYHDPAPMADWVVQAIETECKQMEMPYSVVPSGAFHDSLVMSSVFPTGMIFIPSINGISHSPLESSRDEDIATGCQLLLNTVLNLDK